MGSKRRINQSSCNKDFSCVQGFCPSFITAEGASVRKPRPASNKTALAEPPLPDITSLKAGKAHRLVVAGVGGTGVVTIGALLGVAAHIEGKGVTVLDMAGLAQKGGAVLSHVQIAQAPEDIHATRVALGEADLVIGCDALVTASPEVLSRLRPEGGRAVVNSTAAPTASLLSQPGWTFPGAQAASALRRSASGHCDFIEAGPLAESLLGDGIYANPLLLGYAWQKGSVPLSRESLHQAITLNGVAVDKNIAAFELGRQAAHHGVAALRPTQSVSVLPESLESMIRRLADHLRAYQDDAYAQRYVNAVDTVRERESRLPGEPVLTQAVAKNLAKLMAYKDEYEVARLHTDPAFKQRLREQFEGEPGKDYRVVYHLAPPVLSGNKKRAFGPWVEWVFRALAPMKRLRGTSLDVFGKTAERRMEKALVREYFDLINEFGQSLDEVNRDVAVRLAKLPDDIRGYGHVKTRNAERAATQRETLLRQYREGGVVAKAA